MSEGKQLTVIEHLTELRDRLIRSAIAIAITTGGAFFFHERLFEILKRPAGERLDLIYTEPLEMLSTIFKVTLYSGVAIALPFLFYEIMMFIAPALTPKEKRYVYLMLPGVAFFFLAGVSFAYFVALPPALGFLLSFGANIARPQIKVGSYVSTVSTLIFWSGIAFETPMVLYFLARIGLVSPKRMASFRRYAFLLAFALSAFITPTVDPINQSIVAVPIILLYELGILLARLAWRGRPAT
ncbi:MAG: twin-arginine translocase subunit TatC [Chloroflexi bacterium]|nr:twin-arginine translocase subunit TatC [Chloroflexota bacterium]